MTSMYIDYSVCSLYTAVNTGINFESMVTSIIGMQVSVIGTDWYIHCYGFVQCQSEYNLCSYDIVYMIVIP